MSKLNKALATLAVSMALFTSTPARAQMATIDFANLIQGILDVISTIAQEAGQAEQISTQASQYFAQLQQYQVQYNQLQTDYSNIKSLNYDSVGGLLNTVRTGLATKVAYEQKVKGLYGTVSDAGDVMTKKYNELAASGLSQSEWMKRETKINQERQQGNGYLTNYEQSLLESIGKRYGEVADLQSQITSTDGTHSAMQLMNAQMNALLGSVNQMLEYNTFMGQRETARDVEKEGRVSATSADRSSTAAAQADAGKAAQRSIQQLKNYGGR